MLTNSNFPEQSRRIPLDGGEWANEREDTDFERKKAGARARRGGDRGDLALAAAAAQAARRRPPAAHRRRGTPSTSTRACPCRAPRARRPSRWSTASSWRCPRRTTRRASFTVKYTALDDSTAAAGKWDPTQTAANARQAATDPKAVYYIGEFNSGASEVSIPILNQAGLAQVSPANTYVGLTTNLPGSAAGEPQKYYPTGTRNYLRIVPIDSIQAASDLMAMKQAGCTKVAVANDKEAYGAGLATLLELEKGMYGVTIVVQHGDRPDRGQLPQLRLDDRVAGRELLLLRRHRVQRRRPDHQGRQRRPADRQDLRRRRRVHQLLHRRRRRAACPPRSTS